MTALGAFVRIPLPFSPVPITLQTFFVLLSGAFLGSTFGVTAQLSYLILGVSGVSLFTAPGSGLLYLAGPTAGYLFGFVLASFLVGRFIRHCQGFFSVFALFCLADLALLACGTIWLKFLFGFGMNKTFILGLIPFLPGDIFKALAASILYSKLRSRLEEVF